MCTPDKELCVIKSLDRYWQVTKNKKGPSAIQLFLNYKNSFIEIASSSVSGWIKTILELGNVDLRPACRELQCQAFYREDPRETNQSGKDVQKRNLKMIFLKIIDYSL